MSTSNDSPSQSHPSLPANRAFVVQFRQETEGARGGVSGRVEHVASGQTTRFESWEQLQQFIARVLSSIVDRPP